jgi:hypothetical protein
MTYSPQEGAQKCVKIKEIKEEEVSPLVYAKTASPLGVQIIE